MRNGQDLISIEEVRFPNLDKEEIGHVRAKNLLKLSNRDCEKKSKSKQF